MAAARAHQAEEPPRKVRRLEPVPKTHHGAKAGAALTPVSKAAMAAAEAAAVAATTAAAATAQIHVFKERPPLPRPFGWVPPKLVDNQQEQDQQQQVA